MKTNLNHHHNLAPNQMKLLTQSQTSAVSSPPGFPVSGKVRPRALPVTDRVVVSPEQLHAPRANAKLLCSAKPGHQGASCHQQGANILQGLKVSSGQCQCSCQWARTHLSPVPAISDSRTTSAPAKRHRATW